MAQALRARPVGRQSLAMSLGRQRARECFNHLLVLCQKTIKLLGMLPIPRDPRRKLLIKVRVSLTAQPLGTLMGPGPRPLHRIEGGGRTVAALARDRDALLGSTKVTVREVPQPLPMSLLRADFLRRCVLGERPRPGCPAGVESRCPGKAGACNRRVRGHCSNVCPECSLNFLCNGCVDIMQARSCQ